ncbi:MAG: electron transfer flavoprotein subunit beta/FixA family protein [Deltaproteobacteria bacterium]|nr:electron transfer flavoprotein subunit beta/FixA family protein [Deltaproteobacteria bacterium]
MKILVPMKRVADPDNANKVQITDGNTKVSSEGLEWKPNPFDEYAVEAGLRLLEEAVGSGKLRGEIVVATIGPSDVTQQVRQCLAMGANRGVIVDGNDDDLDATVVARTLAKLVEKESPDLVLMGKQAVDGDSNQTAQILAEMLGWPQATFAGEIDAPADLSQATVTREVDGGAAKVTVKLPAVISVDLRIVTPEAVKNNVTPLADKPYQDGPRYASLRGIMKAKKKKIDTYSFGDLGVDTTRLVNTLSFTQPAARSAGIVVETVEELVQKLKDEAKVL